MREFNENFLAHSNAGSKEPLYTIELPFDVGFTDPVYFTSSVLAEHPLNAVVYDSAIISLSGTSQKIDPIKFSSSVGSFRFSLNDINESLTDLFNDKLSSLKGLRKKRVRVYMGYVGLEWTDYEIIQTQIVDDVNQDGAEIKISCSDIGREEKKDIFDQAKTNIQFSVEKPPETSLSVEIAITGAFSTITVDSTVDEDGSFIFAPSGAILINNEIITYTGRSTTQFTGCTRGTNFSLASTHLVNARVSQTMYTVTAYNTAEFELNEHDANYTDAPNQTVGYFKIKDEVFRYSSKTSTTFINCLRGALNTKSAEHKVDNSQSSDKRPALEEHIYVETNAIKFIFGILLGVWYNNPTSASLPPKWSLGVDTLWVRNSDFTDIGNDLWNNSSFNINTGFKVRFSGLKKTDGKNFLEKELYPLIGCYPIIYSDGSLGLKRMTNILSDAAYVEIVDKSNINQNSSLNIHHDQKAVANRFNVDWGWSEVQNKYTRPVVFIDPKSLLIHQDATPVNLKFRGLHGSIHTQSIVKSIIERLRDRYAAPPIKMTIQCLPSMHSLEVGDVIRIRYKQAREYTSDLKFLDRSMEVQQVSVDWVTGRVNLSLFGSTAKPDASIISTQPSVLYSNETTLNGAIGASNTTIPLISTSGLNQSGTVEINSESISYSGISGNSITGCIRGVDGTTAATHTNASPVLNSYYTDQGGTNIKSLASYSAGAINSESLTGVLDFNASSAGTYYHTSDLTINTGTTSSWENNLELLVKGHLTVNGTLTAEALGHAGAPAIPSGGSPGATSKGISGTVSSLPSGGGIWAVLGAEHAKWRFNQDRGVRVTTLSGLDVANIEYDGEGLSGLKSSLTGSSGSGGRPVNITFVDVNLDYVAVGGAGGRSGGGLRIISQGGSFGVSGRINLSGGDGDLGSSVSLDAISDNPPTIYAGAGAGGAPGGLHWIMDGAGSTVPSLFNNLIANHGRCPVQGSPMQIVNYIPMDQSISKYLSNGNDRPSLSKSASRVQFIPDYVDEGADSEEFVPAGPTNLTATSGTPDLLRLKDGTVISRIKFSWVASTDKNVDHYRIGYKEDGRLRWMEDLPDRDKTSTYIYPVIDGKAYVLVISAINIFGNSSYEVYLDHTVTGKDSPPGNPTSVSLTGVEGGLQIQWTNPADKDLKYIEIFSASTSPADPADLYDKIASGRPSSIQKYVIPLQPGINRYIRIKSIDSSENPGGLISTTPLNAAALSYKDADGLEVDNTGEHMDETLTSNLLVDGDMERADLVYWSNFLGDVSKDADSKYGNYSIKVINGSSSYNQKPSGGRIFIPTAVGEKFTIRFWGKVTSGTGRINIFEFDGDKNLVSANSAASFVSTTWTEVFDTYEVPASIKYLSFSLLSAVGSSAYFDSILFAKLPTETIIPGDTVSILAPTHQATRFSLSGNNADDVYMNTDGGTTWKKISV